MATRSKPKKFTVSDGKLVLVLELCEEGGYCVTSPFEPGLVTEAETVEEAFLMAYDAQKELRLARKQLAARARKQLRMSA